VDRGTRLYDAIQAAFECMPLATLIRKDERRVFVVHGGLLHRPGVTLAQIAAIKRRRDIPYGLPAFEDRLFEDLMWSDPRPITDVAPSDRGAGVFFGPDVTQHFCELNRISLVIRSHECVPEGFLYTHGDRLVTVFSASKYCGRGTNKGAFLLFDAELRHCVRQFSAPELDLVRVSVAPPPCSDAELAARYGANVVEGFDVPRTATMAAAAATAAASSAASAAAATAAQARSSNCSAGAAAGGGAGSATVAAAASTAAATATAAAAAAVAAAEEAAEVQDDSNRKLLIERICLRKSDLYFFYSASDKAGSRDGRVTKLVWADGMRTVLDLDLPWLKLCSSLCDIEPDGRISYPRFLERYRIAMRDSDLSWMEAITERVCEQFFRMGSTLEESFKSCEKQPPPPRAACAQRQFARTRAPTCLCSGDGRAGRQDLTALRRFPSPG
jgi:diadenosine tetraphosphatase ApaH/serine/threonine PP2A family protein phosphatase